ncbi:MAG: hypothetical protein EHM85_13040 [Desulfobacteraceae bacterium]|nr:MAG: hypothetical protein EHM85_13040 [Desulfobacteraceae bacterium]
MKESGDKGFALFFLIAAILVVGALIGAGLALVGPGAKKAKYDQTKDILAAAEQSVISWSAANGRIPVWGDNAPDAIIDEFCEVTANRNDAFARPLVYIYDNNLTSSLCGSSSTTLSYGAAADTAFLIISGAEDMTVNTTPAVSGAFAGNVASGTADILRALSLENLKSQSGCSSFTTGRLRILNNELPKAVSGVSYSATIYAEGGILPYTVWNATGIPAGLTFNTVSAVISGTPTLPGSFTINIQVTDTGGNTTSRTYTLVIS